MIDVHKISELILVTVTENGNRLYRAALQGEQVYWFKTGRKLNTHIGDVSLDNERVAYHIAGRIGVPFLPDSESMDFDGQRWIVTAEAKGNRLLDVQQDLSPEERSLIEEQIFCFISGLGRERARFFGSLTQAGPRFESEHALMRHMLQLHRGAADGLFMRLCLILDELEKHGAFTSQPVLVHYDLWPGNIFYCADRRTVTLIDMERCIYTDSCAEGASLLGMIDAAVLEQRLCDGCSARIAKMYVYRIAFLLERLDSCTENREYQDIRYQLDSAMDTLEEKMRIWEEEQ